MYAIILMVDIKCCKGSFVNAKYSFPLPPLFSTDPLTDPPMLPDLLEYVATSIPAKWNVVGLALNVPKATLDGFQKQHSSDHLQCYVEVFESWKNSDSPPFEWSTIIKALKRNFVKENALAEELRKRLQPE